MNDQMQELSEHEAATVNGGDWSVGEFVGFMIGYYARVTADAFTTQQPDGDFNWARDK